MSARRQLLIVTGEGIECEKESRRFFSLPQFAVDVRECSVPQLLRDPTGELARLSAGDIVFLPGGFSFADHFGSGRLLAHRLGEKGVWQAAIARGLHLLGVCNGFQVLVAAGLFGPQTRLLHNEVDGRPLGFINRWVRVRDFTGSEHLLSVRHGEGRLDHRGQGWDKHVSPFLHYTDSAFDNGSVERVAGLLARHGRSAVIGLMPHPEVSFREADEPDRPGPEFNEKNRLRQYLPDRNGAKLIRTLFDSLDGAPKDR